MTDTTAEQRGKPERVRTTVTLGIVGSVSGTEAERRPGHRSASKDVTERRVAHMRATVSRPRRGGALPAVAVTGATSGLGQALLERLSGREDLGALSGVDDTVVSDHGSPGGDGAAYDPWLAARFEGIDVLVHLAMSFDVEREPVGRRAINVGGTAKVLGAARQAGVARVVLVTSSDVYQARAGGPVPLPDQGDLRGTTEDGLVGDLIEVERLAAHSNRTGLPVTVLRPAPLVGGQLGPGYDGALPRALASTRLLALRGVEPLWQLCHAEDLLAALELAVTGAVTGALPVACTGWLTQRQVEQLTGKRRLELPAAVARSSAARLRRVGATASSAHELDHLTAPVVVDSAVLRAAGWAPRWTNESALRAYLATSPSSDSRSGAYTAAGATVALVGTAALVRRARRRRRT